ncbi:hypothetical protein [Soonwooa sp.]|uniref:hypothetical protein n=1 Tax=Soonwooa sp. TaxID=1938592 RepID=UPI0028ABA47D|nr:hypothetical protein [Soonwooa sp.]
MSKIKPFLAIIFVVFLHGKIGRERSERQSSMSIVLLLEKYQHSPDGSDILCGERGGGA